MVQNRDPDIPVTESSGNVFADLGLPAPDEALAKAQHASQIRHLIKHRRLTRSAAAACLRIDHPEISALLDGRLANFSGDRLMQFLTALRRDIEIPPKPQPRDRA